MGREGGDWAPETLPPGRHQRAEVSAKLRHFLTRAEFSGPGDKSEKWAIWRQNQHKQGETHAGLSATGGQS